MKDSSRSLYAALIASLAVLACATLVASSTTTCADGDIADGDIVQLWLIHASLIFRRCQEERQKEGKPQSLYLHLNSFRPLRIRFMIHFCTRAVARGLRHADRKLQIVVWPKWKPILSVTRYNINSYRVRCVPPTGVVRNCP